MGPGLWFDGKIEKQTVSQDRIGWFNGVIMKEYACWCCDVEGL
jgi:hypothetical protein